MQLGWDETPGQSRVVTEFGIRWIDPANGTQRDVTFGGNGYRNRSVIAIYDEAKQMVYQEVFDGRAYALIADRSGASFLPGVGNQVIRYSALQE